MLAYLEKFNNLPVALKQKVSTSRALADLEALEKKYNIALAALIMKVMVGEIAPDVLADNLQKENLPKARAQELAREMKEKFFYSLDASAAGEPKVKGASFFFSADDETEIRELTEKIGAAENSALAAAALEAKIKEITAQVQINFGSAELADRFGQILKTYLRGIRDRLEAKLTLTKPFLSGGLSFDENSAEKVMALADKIIKAEPAESFAPRPKIKISEPAPAGPREITKDAAYDFSRLKNQKIKSALANDLKKLDTSHELAPPRVKKIESSPASEAGQRPLIKRRFEAENLSQSPKVKLQDVKYVPKVMGPLDELRYMDLTNFRRLDNDPLKSTAKIRDKIDLLAEEAYAKKLEAIRFWRLSPINKLYLEIGHLSIGSGKPIDVIIGERRMNGAAYLTADEFKAIMDLNKSLRF